MFKLPRISWTLHLLSICMSSCLLLASSVNQTLWYASWWSLKISEVSNKPLHNRTHVHNRLRFVVSMFHLFCELLQTSVYQPPSALTTSRMLRAQWGTDKEKKSNGWVSLIFHAIFTYMSPGLLYTWTNRKLHCQRTNTNDSIEKSITILYYIHCTVHPVTGLLGAGPAWTGCQFRVSN